jgi:geranylgeranylglycerol-phosphate geranylgeranyltransferase
MCAYLSEYKKKKQDDADDLPSTITKCGSPAANRLKKIRATIWRKTKQTKSANTIEQILRSQILLFNSRKKWGLLFAVATVSGLFCIPVTQDHIMVTGYSLSVSGVFLVITTLLLPMSTLLIITGMYVLNDLTDADLDRANGKTNRPIPSGYASKRHAIIFVIWTNLLGILIPILMSNIPGILFSSMISLIGVLYSTPKISLKDRFLVKTFAIAIAMMFSLLLGSSIHSNEYIKMDSIGLAYDYSHSMPVPLLVFPIFSSFMLALMVFVTSPLNDLGDISGDKDAGRSTIPIVLGKRNTVHLSMYITLAMGISSWILYIAAGSPIVYDENGVHISIRVLQLVLPLAVTLTSIIIILHIIDILRRLDDRKFIRDSVTKKSMPLHILLQFSLVIGCLLF